MSARQRTRPSRICLSLNCILTKLTLSSQPSSMMACLYTTRCRRASIPEVSRSLSLLESPCGTGEVLRHKHVNAKAFETTDMRLDTPIHQGATRMRGRRLHLNDRRAGNHCPSIPPLTPAQAVQLPGATPATPSPAEKAGTQSTKGCAQKAPHYPRCRIKTSSRSFRRSMPTVTGA